MLRRQVSTISSIGNGGGLVKKGTIKNSRMSKKLPLNGIREDASLSSRSKIERHNTYGDYKSSSRRIPERSSAIFISYQRPTSG